MRNTKGELQDLEVDADGAFESITKLQTQLYNETGGKVNIFDGKKDILLELNRIGNNLNQLTRLANSHIINVVDLKDVKSELKNIWQFLSALK